MCDNHRAKKRRRASQVAFLHSPEYLKILTALPFHQGVRSFAIDLRLGLESFCSNSIVNIIINTYVTHH